MLRVDGRRRMAISLGKANARHAEGDAAAEPSFDRTSSPERGFLRCLARA